MTRDRLSEKTQECHKELTGLKHIILAINLITFFFSGSFLKIEIKASLIVWISVK